MPQPAPPYSALTDSHCKAFVHSKGFRVHWQGMQETLTSMRRSRGRKPPQSEHELPDIAKDPFWMLQGKTRKVLSSPYVPPGDSFNAKHYGIKHMPSPPASARGMAANSGEKQRSRAIFTPPPRSLEPALNDVITSELSLMYAKVLERSESFERRTIAHNENTFFRSLQHISRALRRICFIRTQQRNALTDQEDAGRAAVVKAEEAARCDINEAGVENVALAKRREEVLPTCAVLRKHDTTTIADPEDESVLAEVRWSGKKTLASVDLVCIAVDANVPFHTVSVASLADVIKGEDGFPAVRSWGDYWHTTSAYQGAQKTLEVLLPSLPSRAERFYFAILNADAGAPLTDLWRCWFTIKLPNSPVKRIISSVPTSETIALRVPSGGHSAVVIASLHRNDYDFWDLTCHNECFQRTANVHRLVNVMPYCLPRSVTELEALFHKKRWVAAMEEIQVGCPVFREALVAGEALERLAMAEQQVEEEAQLKASPRRTGGFALDRAKGAFAFGAGSPRSGGVL